MISDPGSLPRRRRPGGGPALRHYSGVLAGVLLLILLTACSGSSDSGSSRTSSGAAGSAGGSGGAGGSGSPGSPGSSGGSASTAATATASAGSSSVSRVSCSGNSCSVTLAGGGSTATVFGTTISFLGVQDGRAGLRVGDQDVSCAPGQSVPSGPLDLECTTVGADSVEFTASLR